jgi:hypothetical protein
MELWTNTFHPWIANVLSSNMDLQFILEEYSCTAYVVEYVKKTNRGIINLHREFIKLQNKYPDQDYTCLMKGVSLQLLKNVEMSSQEAPWYLLRQPMSEASRDTIYIPTCWPYEHQKSQKMSKQIEEENLTDDSTDVWYDSIVKQYEKRPVESMANLTLTDFATEYSLK